LLTKEVRMDTDVETFRRKVARWRGDQRRGGRGYPEAWRSVALQLWERLRRDGASSTEAADQLGVSPASLHLWRRNVGTRRLVPVHLVPELRPAVAPHPVRLVSPKGYRIEAPDVATAAVLLREVG
jgi:hypothetical protein